MKKEYERPILTAILYCADIVASSGGEDGFGMYDENIFNDIFRNFRRFIQNEPKTFYEKLYFWADMEWNAHPTIPQDKEKYKRMKQESISMPYM